MNFSKYVMSMSLTAAALVWFAGCGGGSETAPSADATTTLSGMVADGYLVGAKVCLDKNYNDACDADEPVAITDGTGRYTFTLRTMAATELPLIVEANASTIDLDTHTPIGQEWHFKAMAGDGNFISPLSTLIERELDRNASLTRTQAMEMLQAELGLDINSSTDYVAAKNTQAHNAAKIIARSLANAESKLQSAVPSAETRLIRLLAAKQIRAQADSIKLHALANDTAFVCDVDTTDAATQITGLSSTIASTLTPQLQADLLFMWEEEKLARDVYLTLYEKWGSKIFLNIANNGEQTHIESVKAMLDKYAVSTTGYGADTRGVFVNTDLQTLYNALVIQGNLSVTDAYKVGLAIELQDIKDLDARLKADNLPADIRNVYQNLRKGSENHLAAFTKQL